MTITHEDFKQPQIESDDFSENIHITIHAKKQEMIQRHFCPWTISGPSFEELHGVLDEEKNQGTVWCDSEAWHFPQVARAHHSSPKHLTLSRAAMVLGRRDPPRSSSYFLETGPETSQLPLLGKPTNKEVGGNGLHHMIFGTILTMMFLMQGLSTILCN